MAVEIASEEVRSGIGSRLQAARERKGFTVLQAAERLHVDSHVVEHLEAENFQALGAPVYVRGHLRRYAELVGEEPSELQAMYSRTVTTAQPDLTRVPKAEATDEAGKLLVPAIIGLTGFVLVGAVWWVLSGRGNPSRLEQPTPLSPSEPPAVVSHPLAARTASTAPVSQSVPASHKRPPPAMSAHATAPAHQEVMARQTPHPALAPPAKPVPRAAPTRAAPLTAAVIAKKPPPVVPARPGTAHTASASSASAKPVTPPVKDTQITLTFNSDSWVEVYDATGQRLFYDIGAAGSTHVLHGRPPLRVMLGNGPGVSVSINGHPAAIKPTLRPDGSAHFIISRDGRVYRRNGG